MSAEPNNERLNKIFSEIQQEITPKIIESERNERSINEKLKGLQEKMVDVIRTKCSDAYNWYEKNKNVNLEKQLDSESSKNLLELQQCASKYDYGLRNEMINAEKEMNYLSDSHTSCTQSCVSNPSGDVGALKVCFKSCFDNTFHKTDTIQANLNKKIDEVIFNLNKI